MPMENALRACMEFLWLQGLGDHIFVELEMWKRGRQGALGEMISGWLKKKLIMTHFTLLIYFSRKLAGGASVRVSGWLPYLHIGLVIGQSFLLLTFSSQVKLSLDWRFPPTDPFHQGGHAWACTSLRNNVQGLRQSQGWRASSES